MSRSTLIVASVLTFGSFAMHVSTSMAEDSFKPLKTHFRHTHGTSGGQADGYSHQNMTAHSGKSHSQTASSTCRQSGKARGLTDAELRSFVSDCMKQQAPSSKSTNAGSRDASVPTPSD